MLEPGRVLDRYTVVDELGRGGMAVVYRVRHNTLGSMHALKVLTLHGAGIRDRLVQEGRVQAGLRHLNIVAVTDVIDVEGSPGLVMEYIAGPSLEGWLLENRPEPAYAEALFRGVLAGVRRAHREGLVHRDLKPGNVLLEVTEEGVIPKVADFGLAKALESDSGLTRTRTGIAMGTPAYMAPEQIRDAKNVDERADVFSLGCILYELLVGTTPFEGPDVLSIFNSVCEGRYISASERVPVSRHLEQAIHGCLRVDRDRRIPNCEVLRTVLDGGAWDAAVAPALGMPPPPPGAVAAEGRAGAGRAAGIVPLSRQVVDVHLRPPARSQASLLPDVESASSLVPPSLPPPAPVAPVTSRTGRGLLALFGLGGTALGLVLVAWLWPVDLKVPGADPAPVVEPAPIQGAPAEVVSEPEEPEQEPESERNQTRNASRESSSKPKKGTSHSAQHKSRTSVEEGTEAPEEEKAPDASAGKASADLKAKAGLMQQLREASKSSFQVQGDALAVWLVGQDGSRHSAGSSLGAGSYKIKARFASWDGVVDAGKVVIGPGSAITIRCTEALLSCGR